MSKISAELKKNQVNSWIGIIANYSGDGEFIDRAWIDDSTIDFTNWDNGEPRGFWDRACGAIQAQTGKWKDVSCSWLNNSRQSGYVCQIPKSKFSNQTQYF